MSYAGLRLVCPTVLWLINERNAHLPHGLVALSDTCGTLTGNKENGGAPSPSAVLGFRPRNVTPEMVRTLSSLRSYLLGLTCCRSRQYTICSQIFQGESEYVHTHDTVHGLLDVLPDDVSPQPPRRSALASRYHTSPQTLWFYVREAMTRSCRFYVLASWTWRVCAPRTEGVGMDLSSYVRKSV